jgi:hypothetical protein
MKDPNTNSPTPIPDAIDKFLDELDEKAQADGYSAGLIKNMRQSPEMMDILTRIIGAELKAIKEERRRT